MKYTTQQVSYRKEFCKEWDQAIWAIQKPFNLKSTFKVQLSNKLLLGIYELTSRKCFFLWSRKITLTKGRIKSKPRKKLLTVPYFL